MKKILITLMAATLPLFASAQEEWAGLKRYASANSEVVQNPKAVFFGDSITDGWYKTDKEFFESNNFAGRGISGQVSSQMLVRMRQDVIDLHPKYMVFLGGINDIAINQGPISQETIFGNIVSMIELAKANKIKPIICLLFPVKTIAWRKELGDVSGKVAQLNGWLKDYCKANKIVCVEYFSDVDTSAGTLPESLSKDSIHPNLDGYKMMEATILKYVK